jgi:outer membrane protein TolC/DNA-binding MarR family transcriptional regulator
MTSSQTKKANAGEVKAAFETAQKFMNSRVPPSQADEMPLSAAIFCHVFILNSVLERGGNRVAEGHGLTLPQWMALGCIGHGGDEGVTHSELGQRLMLSKAPITGMVDRLERAGYVRRSTNEKDRRISCIAITPKGEEVWNRVRLELRQHSTQHCSTLSEADQSTLLSMLSRLLNSVASNDPTVTVPCGQELSRHQECGLVTQFLTPNSIAVGDENGTTKVSNGARRVGKRKTGTMNQSTKQAKPFQPVIRDAARAIIISALLLGAHAPMRAQDAATAPGAVVTDPVTTEAPRNASEAEANAAVNNATQSARTTLNQTATAGAAAPNAATGLGDQRLAEGAQAAPLSVIEAIAIAIANNPQRKASLAALEAARARIGTARSAGGPQVNLSGSVDYDRSFGGSGGSNIGGNPGGGNGGNNGGNVGGGGGNDLTQSLGVNASVPLYTGGRVRASTRVAEANAQAQAAQVLQFDQELVLQVALGYLGILRSENLLDVANSNLAVSRERLRVAEVRYNAGAAARLEVFRAQTTLADAAQRRITAVNSVAQSKANVNTLLGRAPETPLRVEPITSVIPNTAFSTDIENAPLIPDAGAITGNAGQGATNITPGTNLPTTGNNAGANAAPGVNTNPVAPNVTAPGTTLPGAITGTNPNTTVPGTTTEPGFTTPGANNPNQGTVPNMSAPTTTTPGATTGTGTTAPGISVPGVTAPGASGGAPVGTGAGNTSSGTVITQPSGAGVGTSSASVAAAQANLQAAARLAGEVGTLTGQDSGALRSAAGNSRSSLAVLEAQLRAAEAAVEVARSQKRPSVDFSISGFLRNPATFLGRFALGLGLGLAQNLVDSGRTRSQVREARATVEQLRQNLTNQKLQVANQIEQALLGLDASQERVESADVAVTAAAEALRAAVIGYRAGVTTNLELSDAQTALLAAQTDAVNSRFDLAQSQAQLAAAVGTLNPIVREQYTRALEEANQRLNLDAEPPAVETPRRRRKFLGIF